MVTLASPQLFTTAPQLLAGLKQRYGEPHRRYHTWAHIEQLLSLYTEVENRIEHQEATVCAIYYHDAIYAVPGPADEEDSAALFKKEAAEHLAPDIVDLGAKFIIATKTHVLGDGLSAVQQSDGALFLDIDMSILGASEDDYRRYAANVREEYAVIPDEMYNAGRLNILKEFLTRDRLFLSDYFHDKLDIAARRNLTMEIKEPQS